MEKHDAEYVRPMYLTNAEFGRIAQTLDGFHGVFYQFWKMGKPFFTNMVPTAAVSFNKEGVYTNFLFNPKFWAALNFRQRMFVIAHECLHVILNHGRRATLTPNRSMANIAMDLVVNHMLVNKFSFTRADGPDDVLLRFHEEQMAELKEKLAAEAAQKALSGEIEDNNVDGDEESAEPTVVVTTEIGEEEAESKDGKPPVSACWLDTIFPGEDIPTNQTYEFYYNLLKKRAKKMGCSVILLLNDHDGLSNKEFSDKIIEKLNKNLSDDEKNTLKDLIEKHFQQEDENKSNKHAGTDAGCSWTFAKVSRVKPKKKWETVIQKWSRSMAYEDVYVETWLRQNRRFADQPDDIMLPADMDDEDKRHKRILVWFFQDTSGSCSGFVDRFFKAAMSLPPDRFDVKMHCFDTRVYETDLKSKKLSGFGGTSFSCIEDYIQSYCKANNVVYPKAVFVITDGYGDTVVPEAPKNWYWFLSEEYKDYVPKQSNCFLLKDYE